jgi:hypothetical protein
MQSLHKIYSNLDIEQDPQVLQLLSEPTERNMRDAETAIAKRKTFSQDQLKGLFSRAVELSGGLGPWAANRFLWKTITTYLAKINSSYKFFDRWMTDERLYLMRQLRLVSNEEPPHAPRDPSDLSEKVRLLINELLLATNDVMGIIFVKERATVTMLMDILNTSPDIKNRYKIGGMVGESNFFGRKNNIYDLLADMDTKSLQKFRSNKINLLIATSVLEEGIDVPACNLVICFDEPPTSKSFIQRRGRARMMESRLVLFFERNRIELQKWLTLERELRQFYEDNEREAQQLARMEDEASGTSFFKVDKTGARLDFDNAKQRLAYFCQVLSKGEYIDNRPDYIIRTVGDGDNRLMATVVLPCFLPLEVRRAESVSLWFSEKNATKDAAFQAFLALYKAKLVNDSLQPLGRKDFIEIERREAIIDVKQQLNPWIKVAQAWTKPGQRWLYDLSHHDDKGKVIGEYTIVLPVKLGLPEPILAHVDRETTSEIRFTSVKEVSAEQAASLPDHTSTLLALPFNHRWPVENRDQVIKITAKGYDLCRDQISSIPFDQNNEDVLRGEYFIRDNLQQSPYTFQSIIPSKPPACEVQHPFYQYEEAPGDVPYLVLKRWTRRSNFRHRLHGDKNGEVKSTKSDRPFPWVFPATLATVDAIPTKFAAFGMLIPTILHEFEVMLVVKTLADTILKPLEIRDLRLIREAISARSASEPVDYERLEFIGDSLLKLCTTVQVFATCK